MADDYYLQGLLILDSFVSQLNNLIIIQSQLSNEGGIPIYWLYTCRYVPCYRLAKGVNEVLDP